MRLWALPWLMCLAVLCQGGVSAAETSPALVVGSKKFTESVLLGEIATGVLRNAGVAASHRAQLGGSRVLWQALLRGDIDLYVEYSGTLRQELLPDDDRTNARLAALLARHGLVVAARLGFDNTYVLGMPEARAEALAVRRISDLARHPRLRLGFSNEFLARGDGWPGLRARYGLPQQPVGMDHDLAYRALASGQLDLVDLYATDAEIAYYGLRRLTDDAGYFPHYQALLLARADVARRWPGALAALARLEGLIDADAMTALNGRVKLGGEPAAVVAGDFLAERLGIRREAGPATSWRGVVARVGERTREHLALVAVSLSAAILSAIPLGIVAFRRPRLGQLLLGATGVLQTVPALALLVFMIPLFGIGWAPAVAALYLYSLLPILRNTHAGLAGIAPALRESALALGLTPWQRLRLVELPLAAGTILAGIKVAAVINIGTATLGALIGAGGYGQPILTGIRLDDTGLILQGAVPAALLALLVQWLFDAIQRLLPGE